jgi:hypothetical protein
MLVPPGHTRSCPSRKGVFGVFGVFIVFIRVFANVSLIGYGGMAGCQHAMEGNDCGGPLSSGLEGQGVALL